jgi:hypothetical protein
MLTDLIQLTVCSFVKEWNKIKKMYKNAGNILLKTVWVGCGDGGNGENFKITAKDRHEKTFQ